MNIPKYVQNDVDILHRFEFSTDEYGYDINKDDKLAIKLFRIGKKYPQKWLYRIIEYLGLFDGGCNVREEDYRNEILYHAEYYFIRAMNDYSLMYDENIHKQIPFIELGLIDCAYSNQKNWKQSNYKPKYESRLIYE